MKNAQVLFPVNVPGAFDYRLPAELIAKVGDFVFAPIGKQMKLGVVWNIVEDDGQRALKDIAQVKLTRPLSCLLYTSPSPRDLSTSRMPSSA